MTPPCDDPFENMCTMIGFTAILWGWAEHGLGLTIWNIDHSPAPGTHMRGHKEIPSNLKNRLSYLRNALKDVSVLEPLQVEGTA